MSQEILNELVMLSIENDFAGKLDYASLIDLFASKNARRAMFKWYLLVNVMLSTFCDSSKLLLSFFIWDDFVSFKIVVFI